MEKSKWYKLNPWFVTSVVSVSGTTGISTGIAIGLTAGAGTLTVTSAILAAIFAGSTMILAHSSGIISRPVTIEELKESDSSILGHLEGLSKRLENVDSSAQTATQSTQERTSDEAGIRH